MGERRSNAERSKKLLIVIQKERENGN
jgi:hypothetical protein